MLTEKQRDALLLELHRAIEESADDAAQSLRPGGEPRQPYYPPNGGLTDAEHNALAGLLATEDAVSGIRKVVANAAAGPLWTLFSLIDATADPTDYEEFWPPFELVESEDGERLEAPWLDAYWLWREKRPDPGWKLDTYGGE